MFFGHRQQYCPGIVSAFEVLCSPEVDGGVVVVEVVACEYVHHVFRIFGLDFTLGIGQRVQGESLHKVVVTFKQILSHSHDSFIVELAKLTLYQQHVGVVESCFAGHIVGLGKLFSFRVGEGGSDNFHHIVERSVAFHGALSIFHHINLCRCACCN